MPAAANTAGHALTHAFGRKMNGAFEECRRQGIAFLPIVAETFGGWKGGEEAGGCIGTPHRAGRGRSCLPYLEQNGYIAAARQCCNPREQDPSPTWSPN